MSIDAVVIDASVTAAWLLPDQHDEAAAQVYARVRSSTIDVHAPQSWLWQCGDVIANAVRHGRVAPDDAMLMWSVLDAVRTRVEFATPEPNQVRACLALAVDHALTLHDAAYLWLAMSLKLPLLTHDERLAAAAARQSVPTLRLQDLQ
jgi:predicted nucleic acid-binding protein